MKTLTPLIDSMLHRPLAEGVHAMAGAILPHFRSAEAILTYGSILRGEPPAETLIDFYVVVTDRHDLSPSRTGQVFGKLLPPNVFYFQTMFEGQILRSKCTVVTHDAFERGVSPDTRSPYFWARFSQPCVLVYARDTIAKLRMTELVSQAVRTAYRHASGLAPGADPVTQWKTLFGETYRTELRPESSARAGHIVDAYRAYYTEVSRVLIQSPPMRMAWWPQRLEGKLLSVLRLCKAAFTFQGGADYAAWKIQRHTGEKLEVQDWQRRHPIIAGLILLPRLISKKVIR